MNKFDNRDVKGHPNYIEGETITICESEPEAEVSYRIHVKASETVLEIGNDSKLVLPNSFLCSFSGAIHACHTELHAAEVFHKAQDLGLPEFLAAIMAEELREMLKDPMEAAAEKVQEAEKPSSDIDALRNILGNMFGED